MLENENRKNKVGIYTLGCKLNFSESSTIGKQLSEHGYDIVSQKEVPDIFVLNTCSVTDFADKKNRKIIRKFKKLNPDSKIVVIGCYAQLKPEEIAEIDGVDLVLGAGQKFQIPKYLEEHQEQKIFFTPTKNVSGFHSSFSIGDRTRSFLKVQTGCDYGCTFCTIPKARGKSRSGELKEIIENANQIAQNGTKEIVLTGVNIGDYGKGLDEKKTFFELLKELDKVDGIERIRISSIEPNLLTDEIIDFVAGSRAIMPHFHIPLQSGSDKILKLMKRRYLRGLYQERVEKIKSVIPEAFIGVDVIVGFPGESDYDFKDTYDFINGLDVSFLHVFTYSERTGTKAETMPESVDMNIRRERSSMLNNLSLKKKHAFYSKFVGDTKKVLIERTRQQNVFSGFTDNYIKVNLSSEDNIQNEILNLRLNDINEEYVMEAELVSIPEKTSSTSLYSF